MNCEIGFQDLEKVLNFAKNIHKVQYWKSMEIPNSAILFQIMFFTADNN